MAWGRSKKSGAPKWSQDEYHKEFASQIREQIKAGLRRGSNRGREPALVHFRHAVAGISVALFRFG